MSKFVNAVFTAIICTGLFSACSKPHTIVVTQPATGSMNAVADGKAILSTFCVGTPGSPVSIITASFASNAGITFNLKSSDLKVATYTLDSSGADNNVTYTSGGSPVLSRSGMLTITSINPGVSYSGTFNFTCVNNTVVTGTFTATEVR